MSRVAWLLAPGCQNPNEPQLSPTRHKAKGRVMRRRGRERSEAGEGSGGDSSGASPVASSGRGELETWAGWALARGSTCGGVTATDRRRAAGARSARARSTSGVDRRTWHGVRRPAGDGPEREHGSRMDHGQVLIHGSALPHGLPLHHHRTRTYWRSRRAWPRSSTMLISTLLDTISD